MSSGAVVGIQARMGSARLPGKVLMDVAGEPLIVRVVERARAVQGVEHVVVLTSREATDDPLVRELETRGIEHRRGSLEDVLSRYQDLARELEPAFVVRITGDAPLVEPAFVADQLAALARDDADFVHISGSEDGAFEGTLGGQGAFSVRALLRAGESDDPRDREHVGSFFFQVQRSEFRHVELRVDDGYRWPGLRLSVDEAPDLELVRRVFEHFDGAPFSTLAVLQWLRENAEVAALNRGVAESADNQACRRLARAATLTGRANASPSDTPHSFPSIHRSDR